jgi:hypothetical protein
MMLFPDFEELQALLEALHTKALTPEETLHLKEVVRRVNGIIERTPASDRWVAGFWRVPGSPARQIVATSTDTAVASQPGLRE